MDTKNLKTVIETVKAMYQPKQIQEASMMKDDGKVTHNCAKHVEHAEWGQGNCIAEEHADPDRYGNIAWYDIEFPHGVEKGVPVSELNILQSESHMHSSMKSKKKVAEAIEGDNSRNTENDKEKEKALEAAKAVATNTLPNEATPGVVAGAKVGGEQEIVKQGVSESEDFQMFEDKGATARYRHVVRDEATKKDIDNALDDSDSSVRHQAAMHKNADKDHLHKALGDKSWKVRFYAAHNPNATKEHLDKAINDKHADVRSAAAAHRNATKEHLDKAINDKHDGPRFFAAAHRNATKEHLDKAINDKSANVRNAVSSHPNATKEHLDKAINDEHPTIRKSVALHPKATKEHLNKLMNDKDEMVRHLASKHPRMKRITKEEVEEVLEPVDETIIYAPLSFEINEADKGYDAYFKAYMKKHSISSLADLKTPEEKKAFFNKVDAGYKAKNEEVFLEAMMSKEILDKITAHEKGGNKISDKQSKMKNGDMEYSFVVTRPDGKKSRHIYHGSSSKVQSLQGVN